MMTPLRNIQSPLTKQDIEYLAESMKCCDVEIEKDEKNPNIKHKTVNINFVPFLRALLRSAPEIEEAFYERNRFLEEEKNKYNFGDDVSNVSSEIDPEEEARKAAEAEAERQRLITIKCDHFDEIETDSFGQVEGGYDEVTVIEEEPSEDPNAHELTEEEQAERDIVGQELTTEPGWNEGEIEVNVNRCFGCKTHYEYSRHSEDQYVDAFNDVGTNIQAVFPNAKIIGNYEKPRVLGELEIYLRGAGWKRIRDKDPADRFFIYRKSQAQKGKEVFPEAEEYMDQIISIALLYGDTYRMAADQRKMRE